MLRLVGTEATPSTVTHPFDKEIVTMALQEQFAHGHALRVLTARWLGLRGADGSRFLLDTATLSIMSHYRDIPAVQRWNAPIVP
jgi:hypothetical protein